MVRFAYLFTFVGLLLMSTVGQAQTPRFCVAYGPRAGLLSENFEEAAPNKGWNGHVGARRGYTGGGFSEISTASGRWRLRTELAYATHRQHYTAHLAYPWRTDLTYTAHEVQLAPLLLVRMGNSPVFVLAGLELAHALSSRVRGQQARYWVSPLNYEVQSINDPYRAANNLDTRLTFGVAAYIRRRFDVTLRGNTGGVFKVYAPGSSGGSFGLFRGTPAQQAHDAGEPGYRTARYIGIALSVGYHFGNPPARPAKPATSTAAP